MFISPLLALHFYPDQISPHSFCLRNIRRSFREITLWPRTLQRAGSVLAREELLCDTWSPECAEGGDAKMLLLPGGVGSPGDEQMKETISGDNKQSCCTITGRLTEIFSQNGPRDPPRCTLMFNRRTGVGQASLLNAFTRHFLRSQQNPYTGCLHNACVYVHRANEAASYSWSGSDSVDPVSCLQNRMFIGFGL